MRRNVFRLISLLAVALALWSGLQLVQTQRTLAGKLVRLHIIAHSDAAADQACKLRVREAVLTQLSPQLANCTTQTQAVEVLQAQLPALREAAATAAPDTSITVRLCRERYPTRLYGTFSLPAGVYTSLRVELGQAQGRNWWCVVFPTLCTAAQTDALCAVAADAGLSDSEIALLTTAHPRYAPEFKILEWLSQLRALLRP